MADPNAPAVAFQQQWSVEGFPGYWATKSGGEVSGETTQAYDGGSRIPEVLGGQVSTSNVVLTKLFRPGLHLDKVLALKRQVNVHRTTITGFHTDPDLGPWGEPEVYSDALLVRVKTPDYDAGSAEAAYVELEFAVREPA